MTLFLNFLYYDYVQKECRLKKYVLIMMAFLFFLAPLFPATQEELCETCVQYNLKILEDKLLGSSEQLPGYDISILLPKGFLKEELTVEGLITLIDSREIKGKFISPKGKTSDITYTLSPYHKEKRIFMKTSNGWYPWDSAQIRDNELIFTFHYWYCPPASKMDLEIVDLALEYLKEPALWHQKDDRKCKNDKKERLWSLFCALKIASIEKMGEYNHRNTVIQTARFVIDELHPNHEFDHTLMDFNNAPTTSYGDMIQVLKEVRKRILEQLKTPAP